MHTKGPWAATNKEYGTWATDVRAGADGSGRRIATTFVLHAPAKKKGESLEAYRARYDNQGRINEANARLIAASPDLLEALIQAQSILKTLLPNWSESVSRQIVLNDAAIAKATGAGA